MKTVETHIYATPSGGDRDAYSIGVLNVTREEAGLVRQFCMGQLMERRRMAQPSVPVKPAALVLRPVVTVDQIVDTTSEPADRFSGLDLG